MSKTITGNTTYRKHYALLCILKGYRTRSFDNCFEMGDGDEVVKYIMGRALEQLPNASEAEEIMSTTGLYKHSAEYKLLQRHETQKTIVRKLKETGLWAAWSYFIEHGSYTGYKAA